MDRMVPNKYIIPHLSIHRRHNMAAGVDKLDILQQQLPHGITKPKKLGTCTGNNSMTDTVSNMAP